MKRKFVSITLIMKLEKKITLNKKNTLYNHPVQGQGQFHAIFFSYIWKTQDLKIDHYGPIEHTPMGNRYVSNSCNEMRIGE